MAGNNYTNNYNGKKRSLKRGVATAPFNFVRLPRIAVDRYQSVQELPRHDRIYREEDGYYSGEITYDVVVDGNDPFSALIIGKDVSPESSQNNKDDVRHFFRNNDDKCTIPGSTMRGLIRNNVQILGMCNPKKDIANTRFMYRDMARVLRNVYNKKVKIGNGEVDESKVQAGYIVREGKDVYRIYPTQHIHNHSYFRIHENKLRAMADSRDFRDCFMYADSNCKERNRFFKPGIVRNVSYSLNGRGDIDTISSHGKGPYVGTLVSSGRVSGKYVHYLIPQIDMSGSRIPLKKNEINAYEDDLSRKKQIPRKDKPFYELPQKFGVEGAKPVFYIQAKNGTTYFGMTPHLRIFYDRSVHAGIPSYLDTEGIDYADGMFGTLDYKSRLSFSDAVSEDARTGDPCRLLLAEPKASCYPEYLFQEGEGNEVTSYNNQFVIRGIKQYWLMDAIKPIPAGVSENVCTKAEPVEQGVFSGKIYYENLQEDELGLLLYAIYLRKDAFQSIGMGKPYGYGKVKINNIHAYSYDFSSIYMSMETCMKELDVIALIDSYREYMQSRLPWKDGHKPILEEELNVKELLYMKTKVMSSQLTDYMKVGKIITGNAIQILPQVMEYENRIMANMARIKENSGDSNHYGQRGNGRDSNYQGNRQKCNDSEPQAYHGKGKNGYGTQKDRYDRNRHGQGGQRNHSEYKK